MISEDLKYVLENFVVYHDVFAYAQKSIDRCYQESGKRVEPLCFAVIGESRTGKSYSLEHSEEQHPPIRKKYGLEVPIVRIKVPSKPTVKGLVSELLHKIGDPLFDRGTEQSQTIRLKKLLVQAKTKIVMLDEFQHFYDQATKKVQHHAADWLKIVVDDVRIALVVAGLPTSVDVIKSNAQLHKRFIAPAILKRFDWRLQPERDEFLDILFALKKELYQFELPDIESEEVGFRIYCASGGLLGYVIKIFKFAISNVVDKEKTTITLNDLAIATKEALFDEDDVKAFSRNFYSENQQAIISGFFNSENEKSKIPEYQSYLPRNSSELLTTV